ncbi:hypothetical protein Q427_16635 [Halomonas sp. BC04]|nr:hypothetical protein Q427_16635 [Halomonas sp. BC04]
MTISFLDDGCLQVTATLQNACIMGVTGLHGGGKITYALLKDASIIETTLLDNSSIVAISGLQDSGSLLIGGSIVFEALHVICR